MAQDRKGPVTQLREQFAEKSNSCKKLEEEYLRALADFDNLRKRTQRDGEVSRRMALEALVLDLVPVLDNFDRAVQTAGEGASAESLKKGMDLIRRQLCEALSKHGISEYSCVGSQFDPRRADAISFIHTDEHKPGTVVSEVCKGYSCGERVLRPARVVVAKEPDRSQKREARSQSAEETDGEDGRRQKAEARSESAEGADGESQEQKAESQDSEAKAEEIEKSDTESND
jgi:molecular chaperone GrpE